MAQYIFETDGSYVNFNGGGGLWRLARASNCIAWRFDETGDLFFDVYDQQYIVKAENIADVVIDETPLAAASDFPDAITAVFTGLGGSGGGVESVVAGSGIDVDDTDPANPVVSATGGALLSATVELNDAQIKALPTTAIEIVPEQGVGKTILVLFGILRWNSNSAFYTNVNENHTISIGYGLASTGEFIDHAASPTTVSQATGIRTSVVGPPVSPHPTSNNPDIVFGFFNAFVDVDFNNSSLVVYVDNQGSGDLTGGDAANTLKVTVYYIVHDL